MFSRITRIAALGAVLVVGASAAKAQGGASSDYQKRHDKDCKAAARIVEKGHPESYRSRIGTLLTQVQNDASSPRAVRSAASCRAGFQAASDEPTETVRAKRPPPRKP